MTVRLVPDSFSTIAGALAAAGSGDEVQVRQGTYAEGNLVVSCAALRAYAGDEGLVVIEGDGTNDTLRVHAAATIEGLEVQGHASGEAIQLNSAGVTVQDCTLSGVYRNGIQSTSLGSQTIRRNRLTGACASGYAVDLGGTTGNAVQNNLVEGSHYRGIRPGAGTTHYNTIVDCTDHGYYLDAAVAVRNCVAASNSGAGFYLHHASCTADYCLTYSNGSGYTVGTGGTWGANNLTSDPTFVDASSDDYRPGTSSPLLSAAVDVGVTEDINGDTRPVGAGYDIGAFEWQSTPPVVTSASWTSKTSVTVVFDQDMDSGHNLTTAGSWSVLPLFGGTAVTVLNVDIVSADTVLLTVSPQGWDTLYGVFAPVSVENIYGDVIGSGDRQADYVSPVYSEQESADAWGSTSAGDSVDVGAGFYEMVPWAADAAYVSLTDAVWLSLFSDRRAVPEEGELLPDDQGDPQARGGWWADSFAADDRIGSKLWLLRRSTITAETVNKVRDYSAEALAWLVDDGLAARVDVAAERSGTHAIALTVTVSKSDGSTEAIKFPDLWEVI